VAAAIGVCVAAFYYISMIRNTEKIRRRDMVFQRLNVNMIQHYKVMYEVHRMIDWETVEDFYRKYYYIANPEAFPKILYLINHYNSLGILVRDGIVKAEEIFQLYSAGSLVSFYDKFRPYLDITGVQAVGDSGVVKTDPYFSGIKFLYGVAKRMYPNAGILGIPRSTEEAVERAMRRQAILGDAVKQAN
jgi:hypothetical protein